MNKSSNNKEITKGSRVREYGYGTYIDSVVLSDPIVNDRGQIEFYAKTQSGAIVSYMKSASSLEVMV